jgi:hypothetical protein
MRVLMVSDVYFPRVNGVSTSIRTFREALVACGVTVDLVAPRYGQEPEQPGIYRVPARGLALDPEDRMMHRSALKALMPMLKAQGYDLVHIQTPFVAHYAALRFARALGCPVVTTYHTFFEEYLHLYLPLLPASMGRWIARRFSRSQCNETDGIISPSTAMHTVLRQYGITKPIAVIPTGIPMAEFTPGDGVGFRARHGIPAHREVALYVGRAAHEKNIDLLLQVADRVRRTRPNFLLLVAGEGPALGHLHALAERLELGDHVRFLGYLDRATALRDCYSAADVFVFGSTTETQGLVLLEAMAMGLPTVAVPAMGTVDILGPGRGCVATTVEADRFAADLCALLADGPRRARLARDAVDYVETVWAASATARRLAEFYRETLARRIGTSGITRLDTAASAAH